MKNWQPKPGDVFIHPEAISAQQLIERVDASDAGGTRKRDLKSAIRCVARILGSSLGDLPMDPVWLRQRLDAVIPEAHGLTQKTWGKRLSEFGQALRMAGIGKRLAHIPLSGAWESLGQLLRTHGNKGMSCWLTRFLRFGCLTGLDPSEVCFETILAYEAEVRAVALNKDPAKAAYYAARMWDKAVDEVAGWPQNRVGWVDRRNIYCLPWSAFPVALEADVQTWLDQPADDDIFSDWNPGARRQPITREKRRYELQRFASALVHAGVAPDGLTSIAVLVEMDHVKRGLRWLRDERFGGALTGGLQNIAIALANAARWHVGVDPVHQARLNEIVKRCGPSDRGMTLKNRLRMEPFKDPRLVQRHLDLPEKLFDTLSRQPNANRAAVQAETALAIAFLTWCPIRIGNLLAIEIDRHLIRERRRRRQRVYLLIPADEVKNRIDIKFELPPLVVDLLDRFISSHRPLLAPRRSRFLFSRRTGDAPIDYNSLALRIKKLLRAELGVDFSSHNFRHLAGLIWLLENPTGFEVVRRFLGHKAASTAMNFYVGLQTDAAHKAFTDLLKGYREKKDG
ncbi:MAG: site-specific integrase [Pseudomonadota bacterium]